MKKLNIISWGILYLSVLCCFANATAHQLAIIFNSDSLCLPYLYHNLVYEGGNPKDWHPSFAVSPDFIFYYLINRPINLHFIQAHSLYAFFQISVIVYLSSYIFKKTVPEKYKKYVWLFPLFFSTLFIEAYFFSHDILIAHFISSYCYHTQEYIFALLVIALYFSGLKEKLKLFLTFLFCFIGAFSSILFLILLTTTICLTCIFNLKKANWKSQAIYISVVLSASLLGFYLFQYCVYIGFIKYPILTGMYQFDHILECLSVFYNQILDYLAMFGFRMVLIIAVIIAIPICIWILLRRKNTVSPPLKTLFILFILYIIITLSAPIINGNYRAWDLLRYNVSAFYFGIVILVYFTAVILEKLTIRFYKLGSAMTYAIPILLLCMIMSKFSLSGLKNYYNYYPDDVKEIDAVCKKYQIKRGVSEYWTARWATMFSKSGVEILAVYDSFCLYELGSNITSYYDSDFDFIIVNKLEQSIMRKKFAIKDSIVTPNYKFFIVHKFRYPKNQFCLQDLNVK